MKKRIERPSAVTIGDVNIDHIVDLSDIRVDSLVALNGCLFKNIHSTVGGNGLFFAQAALKAGFKHSYLLATLGADPNFHTVADIPGKIALESIQASGVAPLISLDTSRGTGQVIILYQDNDKRYMIGDRGANKGFVEDNLPPYDDILGSVSVLYVSGYCLMDPVQRASVLSIADRFNQSGTLLFVDTVPHNLYSMVSFNEYITWVHGFNAISFELSTLYGFFGIDPSVHISDISRQRLLSPLRDNFDLSIIRLNSMSDFIITDKVRSINIRVPYHDRLASLRFTDSVTAHILFEYINNNFNLCDDFSFMID